MIKLSTLPGNDIFSTSSEKYLKKKDEDFGLTFWCDEMETMFSNLLDTDRKNRVRNDNHSFESIHSIDPNWFPVTTEKMGSVIDRHDQYSMSKLQRKKNNHRGSIDSHYRESLYKCETTREVCVVGKYSETDFSFSTNNTCK